ncbi:MAG: hypothetical protein KF846_12225 [Cyclobacteriaceae bacterium]|nr:hypothetical protein [Cyclobacteriaceae bacterium]MBX2956918.1 hypothetical protein [Cyclobacteriaceae bacterium]
MNKIISLLFLLAVLITPRVAHAQGKKSRLQPGKFYEAGETLYAPRFGFTAKVPAGWQGSLPRESEVFLLQTTTPDVFGEVYVFGREVSDLASLKKIWIEGTDLSESIRIKAVDPVIKGDMISSEVVGEGQSINKGNRGYIAARCNPDGPCITAFTIMPKQFYEPIKNAMEQFLLAATFEPPNNASPYATLNWNEFLANKALVTYAYVEGGSKDSEIHLCANGSFTATIKKTGFMKNQNPQYHGKLSGTWSTKGIGEQTNITFTFSEKSKLAPIEIALTIKEDKVYAGDERYFVAQSTKCK